MKKKKSSTRLLVRQSDRNRSWRTGLCHVQGTDIICNYCDVTLFYPVQHLQQGLTLGSRAAQLY